MDLQSLLGLENLFTHNKSCDAITNNYKMNRIVVLALSIILFLSSCELEYTQYEVQLLNNTSYPLVINYKTFSEEGEVKLSNIKEEERAKMIYRESFEGVLPLYNSEGFNDIVQKVDISIVLEDGSLLKLNKDFTKLEDWGYWERYDDQHIIHKYYLDLSDEDLE